MSTDSIFLTGASGFVGQNILEYFPDAEFAVFRNRSEIPPGQNIRNQVSEIHPDIDAKIWVNLAGKAHDLSKVQSDKPYWEVNYNFAIKVYEQFLKSSSAQVFIHMSSIKAVADEPIGPVNENTPEDPQTVYGQSKLEADRYIMKNLPSDGKKVYLLRPAMIHGKGNKGNLNSLYNYCQSSLPYILGNYNGLRSYLSIDNLLVMISELMKGKIDSGIYCLSDKEVVATNDLVRIIYEEIQKKPAIVKVPRFLMQLLALAGEYLPIPIDKDTLKKVGSDYVVESDKLRSALAIDLAVSAEEGLRQTIKSFAQN